MTDIEDVRRMQEAEDQHDLQLERYLRSIGASSLASELGDLRFRTRIIEAQRYIDAHDALLSFYEKSQDEAETRLINAHSQLFDKAQAYLNFIVTIGYAGFFAIWSFLRASMNPWDMKLIALLLGLSLLLFVVWTVFTTFITALTLRSSGAVFTKDYDGPEELVSAFREHEKRSQKLALRVNRFWVPVFLVTVAAGFLAATALLALLFFEIVGSPFTLKEVFDSLILSVIEFWKSSQP